VGYKAFSHVMLEGEMSYDFDQAFATTALARAVRHGGKQQSQSASRAVGPKCSRSRAIRPFFTLKGGFVNFRLDPRPATFGTFTDSVNNLRANNVSGAIYPGAGLEGHLGPVGLRLEAGDEIYSPEPRTTMCA